jgi:hypothetical protein
MALLADERGARTKTTLEQFQEKREPVFRLELRKNKELGRFNDSVKI